VSPDSPGRTWTSGGVSSPLTASRAASGELGTARGTRGRPRTASPRREAERPGSPGSPPFRSRGDIGMNDALLGAGREPRRCSGEVRGVDPSTMVSRPGRGLRQERGEGLLAVVAAVGDSRRSPGPRAVERDHDEREVVLPAIARASRAAARGSAGRRGTRRPSCRRGPRAATTASRPSRPAVRDQERADAFGSCLSAGSFDAGSTVPRASWCGHAPDQSYRSLP
jgi:hypothetical protein